MPFLSNWAVPQKTILLVEDDDSNRSSVSLILKQAGYEVVEASNGHEALGLLRKKDVDLILSDLRMPLVDGMDLLKTAQLIKPHIDVIIMTAHGTIENAVEAIKEGAFDFLAKPFKKATLLRTVEKNLERRSLVRENMQLKEALKKYESYKGIIGKSAAIRHVLDMISQVASSSATVLIQGESGTGKELVAEAIHRSSSRASEPFVKLSCSAIPDTLLEAELFGYEKGAFTGAQQRREGRFEHANHGSLFLDEIGELSPATQVKLLRVLQEGEFERLGSNASIRCDVRILAASNRNLEEAVKEGLFREDLFYRLNVITLTLPPLRSRKEDIPLLLDYFIHVYADKNKKSVTEFDPEALKQLMNYSWPGNVRELENAVERAVVLSKQPILTLDLLSENIRASPVMEGDALRIPLGMPLDEVERLLIKETLKKTDGDKNLAAKLLGIAPRTVYRKLSD